MATDELWPTLLRFHREIIAPEIRDATESSERRMLLQMHSLNDGLAHQLENLKTEYHMLVAGLKRVEDRLDGVEGRLGGVEGRLGGVEGRLDAVEGRLGGVEAELAALRAERTEILGRMAEVEGRVRVLGPRRR